MKKSLIAIVFIITFLACLNAVIAAVPKVGFIAMGDKGPFTEPALQFAQKKLNATLLDRKDISFGNFSKYAVVWWHDGDSDPGALKEQEIKAFVDYGKAGGAVLLTAWAIRYATPMGLENVEARQFGPVPEDGISVGIIMIEDGKNLPIWKGLKNQKGDTPKVGDRIQVNSTGYPKSGDYFDKIWKNFITLANAWGPEANDWGDRIAAFGYWKMDKGKIFNMNWRLPNFHANNKDIGMLEILTTNVINWLGEGSLFFSVNSMEKLATTWGNIRME